MKTGEDGRLFGSVTSGTICDELKHQFDATVEKRKIQLENPIKQLGEYQVDIKLHHDVSSTLKVRVESANPVEGSADGDAGDNARKGRKPAAAAVSRSK